MVRKLMTAGVLLAFLLVGAGCGTQNATTSAKNWSGTNAASQEWEIQRKKADEKADETWGNGTYHADENGKVKGFDTQSTDGTRGNAKEDMKDAGDNLKDAGRDLGNAAKNAGDAAKDAAKSAGDAAKDAARGVGDAAEDTLDGITGAGKQTKP